jgi:hypothetical protein
MPYLRTFISHPLEREPGCPTRSTEGMRIEAATIAGAVAVAEKFFDVRIVPHDPPKWFRVYGLPGLGEDFGLVDIHVYRAGGNICIKQDLKFLLLDADIVAIGALAC